MKNFKINDFMSNDLSVNWDLVWNIPEFSILKTTKQSIKWHKEGNVDIHTRMVVDNMINIIKESDTNDEPIPNYIKKSLVMAALCHDLGKGVTTVDKGDGKFSAYGHELESERITRKLLWDESFSMRERICVLVRYHMYIRTLLEQRKNLYQSLIELSQDLHQRGASLRMLFMLMKADNNGSICDESDYDNIKIDSLYMLSKHMNILDDNNIPPIDNLEYKKYERINKGIKDIEVIFMIGLPGGGKDTEVNKILKFEGNNKCVIISRDDIRVKMGLCKPNEKVVGTTEQEAEVTRLFNEELKQSIEKGIEVIIINNINLKKKYRTAMQNDIKKYCKGKYFPIFNYCYIETSMENHLERRKGQISPEVFKNMVLSFDFPSNEEYSYLFCHRN